MEAPPASDSLQLLLPKKKTWIRIACDKCIEAKHLMKHKQICGTEYRGKTHHNCKQKECQQMISALWKTNFERSDDCSHNTSKVLSKEASSVSEHPACYHKCSPTKISSTQPRNKIMKAKREAARTPCGVSTKRTGQQSISRMTELFADSDESAGALDMPSGLLERVRNPLTNISCQS
jgi:hypothetical protein